MIKKPFVLSGGGARGFAHLGVAKALAEKGVYPQAISGTSAGAIAGAFLANGFTPEEVIEILAGKLNGRMMGWNSLRTGLMSFRRVGEYIERNLRYKTFEELPIPLYITATSFVDGRQKVFKKGNLMEAITASCAIPAIFPAHEIEGIPYVDGALANNLPIEPFRRNKKDIIAVHVNPIWDIHEKRGLRAIVERAFHLSFAAVTRQSAHGCLMFIEPKDLIHYNIFDLGRANEIVDVGYTYAEKFLNEHQDLIKQDALLKRLKMNIKQFIKN